MNRDPRGASGPLVGIRVLDLCRLLPGGFATAVLGDLGAEVIKIEQPGVGDYMRWREPRVGSTSAQSWVTDRNKKSVAIDLKHPGGREAFCALVRTADVLVESFRPGVVNRLGIGYEDVRELNARLVYCSLSGYGQDGPLASAAGHDVNYIGRAGLLSITGSADGSPVLPGVQIADLGGGAMMCLAGVLASLVGARKTGEGEYVDIAMTDGAFAWLSVHLGVYFADDICPSPGAMTLNGNVPNYNVYECADGRWLTVGALEEHFFAALCNGVERPDLLSTHMDPEAVPTWRQLFKKRSREEWLAALQSLDACVGPVNDFSEAVLDQQLIHREMVVRQMASDSRGHLQLSTPIKLRNRPASIRSPAPRLGADTRHYLLDAGLSPEAVDDLFDAGAIADDREHATPASERRESS